MCYEPQTLNLVIQIIIEHKFDFNFNINFDIIVALEMVTRIFKRGCQKKPLPQIVDVLEFRGLASSLTEGVAALYATI